MNQSMASFTVSSFLNTIGNLTGMASGWTAIASYLHGGSSNQLLAFGERRVLPQIAQNIQLLLVEIWQIEIHADRISALVETQKFLDILTSLPNMWSPNQGYIFFKKAVRDGGIKIIPCKEFWKLICTSTFFLKFQ